MLKSFEASLANRLAADLLTLANQLMKERKIDPAADRTRPGLRKAVKDAVAQFFNQYSTTSNASDQPLSSAALQEVEVEQWLADYYELAPESESKRRSSGGILPVTMTRISRLRQSKDTTTREEAFEVFYLRYYMPLIQLFVVNGIRQETAHDLATNLLLKLKKRLLKFEYEPERGSFRGYLNRCVTNAVADHFNSQKQQTNCDEAINSAVAREDVEDCLRDCYERELLLDAWRVYFERHTGGEARRNAEIFRKIKLEGERVEQVAQEYQLTKWNVYKICHRMFEKLRAIVKELNGEDNEPS